VPGYEAPQYTVAAAARVALVLGSIVGEAWRKAPSSQGKVTAASLRGVLEARSLDESMPGVPEHVRLLSLMMWSQIFGCISFELFGHYKGTVRSASRFFNFVVDEVANHVLPPT
jgi:hypothetical protein